MKKLLKKITTKISQNCQEWQGVLITAPTITAIVIGLNQLGIFQVLEWAAYDQFFRLRPLEKIDQRIVIVAIDENDLTQLNEWPLSDQTIAQVLNIIKAQKPRVIGLDIYRDLVVEPGHEQIVEVFESTPNLIGVEKVSGRPVAPSPILSEKGQVGLSDLVVDPDSKVRRALLSIRRKDGEIQLSLGTKAALKYLEKEGINLRPVTDEKGETNSLSLQLGSARFEPLKPNVAGYVNADNGGYQILLNYRGIHDTFEIITLQDLLKNNFDPNLMRDRIVFVGSVAESLNDQFYTPFSSLLNDHPLRTGGIIIHANITSQIISSALEGRPLIQGMPTYGTFILIFICSSLGAVLSWKLVINRHGNHSIYAFISLLLISMGLPCIVLLGSCYAFFLNGWWIPVIAPGFAICLSALSIPSYQNFALQKLASTDALTTLHNRRYFDTHLAKLWEDHKEEKISLSIIVCDVDYFKFYNDYYGHPTGDKCLQEVSQGILTAVRKTDLVARYGGEEFVVILPNSNPAITIQVAQRICQQIRSLEIEHNTSKVSKYVTVSCGSATMVPDQDLSPKILMEQADQALYQAKEKGRNRSYPV